jgi:hypothetical protein
MESITGNIMRSEGTMRAGYLVTENYMKAFLCWQTVVQKAKADMQKVEILPPADFQVKFFAKGQNQTLLLEFMNFRQFS